MLGILGAVCIILTLAVIILTILVFSNFRSINDLHLFPLPPAGGSGCKLCPRDWVLHGDKCYWLSSKPDTWSKSHDDCSRKGSQMLVIQDREQMVTYILCRGTERTTKWAWIRDLNLGLFPGVCTNPPHSLSAPATIQVSYTMWNSFSRRE
uniref:C-type lectin domain-containing protein n=1 Tax=Chrysemys picta bellii TaxID=8478 RepID=A0A8C3HY36_CHRPI